MKTSYQLNSEVIDINGWKIKLSVIKNIDALFDALLENKSIDENHKEDFIPYWADLWPSAVALSNYIVRSGIEIKNKKVLEIGCGLALPGIIAGKLGANITMTDYLSEALDHARLNWSNNHKSKGNFHILDWREPNPNPNFASDLILASDIAYERKSFPFLLKAFKKLLNPGGRILISEPSRAYEQPFFQELQNHGFVVSTTHEILEFRGIQYKINIHELGIS